MTKPYFDTTRQKGPLFDWKPKDVFKGDWSQEYKKLIARLSEELILLNGTLAILHGLEEIRRDFPAPILRDVRAYLATTCLHFSILAINKLTQDSGFTLSDLRKEIRTNLKDEQTQKAFDKNVRENPGISSKVRSRIQKIRNKAVVHLDKKYLDTQLPVDLKMLLELRDRLINYFHKMVFPGTLNPCYVPGMIEQVYEFLAEKEPSVSGPETNPIVWCPEALRTRRITKAEVDKINKWRERLGRAPIVSAPD